MALPTETTALLGTTTNVATNQTVTVYYDPSTFKYYETSPSTPSFYQEVTNTLAVGSYLNQFAAQRQNIDRDYRARLSQENPDSPLPPDLQQLTQSGGSQLTVPTETPINQELELAEPLEIFRGSYIKYPKEMTEEQDKIKFTAVEITKGNFGGKGLNFEFGSITYTPKAGSVMLAIQAPISDQNSVDWGPDSVNALDAALFNLSLGVINPAENAATSEPVKTFLNGLYNNAKTQQSRIQRYLAGQAAGLNNVLSRTDGAILNPNLELLFQGPQLRPFTFSFKMSARRKEEADDIKKIIKYFKYFMAVRKEKNNLFLRAPYVFAIEYLHKNSTHPGMNLISSRDKDGNIKKACALTNCSVDYTPLGSYATYADGTMVSYTLSLQFQEITPVYDTDYADYADHPIGF